MIAPSPIFFIVTGVWPKKKYLQILPPFSDRCVAKNEIPTIYYYLQLLPPCSGRCLECGPRGEEGRMVSMLLQSCRKRWLKGDLWATEVKPQVHDRSYFATAPGDISEFVKDFQNRESQWRSSSTYVRPPPPGHSCRWVFGLDSQVDAI